MTDILTRPATTEADDTERLAPTPPSQPGRRVAGALLAALLATATGYLAYQAVAGDGSSRTIDNSSEVAEYERHLRLASSADTSFDQAERRRALRLILTDPFLEVEFRRQSRLAAQDNDAIDISHEEAEAQRMERLNPQKD